MGVTMDTEKQLDQIAGLLDDLSEDTSVPRNIRRGAKNAVNEWLREKSKAVDVRIFSAVNILQELADDPNIPMHARTQIYNILNYLESVDTSNSD